MLTTLRSKIILLTCFGVFIISAHLGSLVYFRTTQITINAAIDGIAGEARLVALQFKSSYYEMLNDAIVVSKMPPVQGLIRSKRANDIDPNDGSSSNLWRKRMEEIFISIMSSRKHYTQMRYIGIADNGKEIVRVNRKQNGFEKVSINQLQKKSAENYFNKGLSLKEGEFYFSEVTYNREFGQTDASLTPTTRVVIPVYDEQKNIFGLIVINADYNQLLRAAFSNIAPTRDILVMNNAGDYIEHTEEAGVIPLEFHDNYTKQPPDFLETAKHLKENEKAFLEDGSLAYFVRVLIDPNNLDSFLGVVLRIPKDVLLNDVYKVRQDMFLISILFIAISIVITAFISKRLTDPLNKMTHKIINRKEDEKLLLPINLKDEIGELARSFKEMTDNLIGNINKRKLAEAEQKKLIKSLARSNEELDNFAYITSHDLKEPLDLKSVVFDRNTGFLNRLQMFLAGFFPLPISTPFL